MKVTWIKEESTGDFSSQETKFPKCSNLYSKDRWCKYRNINGFWKLSDYWYGVDYSKENGLTCIECNQAGKTETLLVIHDVGMKEMLLQCKCGAFHFRRVFSRDAIQTNPLED